jgi:hypothetical protein
MGIEEMFRDCQTGGYHIEGTDLRGNQLIKMILLMTIASKSAIFQGTEMSEKAGAKICISLKISEKSTEDAVHLAWVRMEKSGQITLNNIVKQYRN